MGKSKQERINEEIEAFLTNKGTNALLTPVEIAFIQQYEGAGGHINNVSTKASSKGDSNPLYEFYTPTWICDQVYELAVKHGFKKGSNLLEPACGTGRMFQPFLEKGKCKVTAFELTQISYQIAKLSYPKANIYNSYFETSFLQEPKFRSKLPKSQLTWLEDYPFDLVVGNPPFGQYSNRYSSYFTSPKFKRLEMFFIYKALELLRPEGLLIYVIPSNILRNGFSYNKEKEHIGKLADIIDAYRLPPVFKSTGVPTDIIVLKRK